MSDQLSTPPTIRAATAEDMDGLVLLIDMLNISERNDRQCDRASLKNAFFEESKKVEMHLDVVVQGHALLAFAFYYWGYDLASESYGCHLADFAVHKDVRREGVGSALLAHVGEQCIKQGGSWLSLTSARNNHGAKQFYAACGMQHVDVDFFAIGPRGIRALSDKHNSANATVAPLPSERI